MNTVRVDNYSGRHPELISYWKNERTGHWIIHFPKQDAVGALALHKVEEHEDGTITVTPSILVSDDKGPLVHGYLTRGDWRDC